MQLRTAAALLLFSTMIVGCKSKKSACEEARDLQIAAAKKLAAPISATIKDGKVEKKAPSTEANVEFEAKIARMEAGFVAVCEEIGDAKVLDCVKTNLANLKKDPPSKLSPECAAVFATFKERIP